MGARYINTDLILRSRKDRTPLAHAIDGKLASIIDGPRRFRGLWQVSFETYRQYDTPAASLERLLQAVEALGPEMRAEWDACHSREFDIGYEGVSSDRVSENPISTSLLRRIADAGGSLKITIYRLDDAEPSEGGTERGGGESA